MWWVSLTASSLGLMVEGNMMPGGCISNIVQLILDA